MGLVSPPDAIRLAVGDQVDDFEIVEVVAEGGTSTTYRATSRTLERDVALKLFRAAAFAEEADAVRAARSDASSVARLEHPGIAPVFAAGEHGGGLYIASALSSGETLAERGAARVIAPSEAARAVTELADALAYAHAHGVLHRDVRPDCVMISRWGHALLRDFGVTRTSGRTGMLTRAEVLESLRYTAPETILGRPATAASDVYGLAAVAVWALTGGPPYHDRPAAELVVLRTSAPPPTLAFADGRPAEAVTAAIAGGMALDPAHRPEPAAFAAQLAAAVAALPAEIRAQAVPFISLEEPPPAGPPGSGEAAPSARDLTRVEHRRPVAAPEESAKTKIAWTTYAACVTIVLLVGFAAIGIGRMTAPKPPAAVSIGDFSLSPPAAWTVESTGERLELSTASGGSATLAVTDGRLPGDPVPAAEVGAAPAPKPEPAMSDRVPLVVYRSDGQIVVARPTTEGALWARCSRVSEQACAALVTYAKSPGKPVPATPDQGVAGALRDVLGKVQQESGVALSEMEGSRKQRAAAAEQLSTSLRDAAGSLKIEGADPGTAAALALVSKALATQAAALEDLGDAIDRRSAAADRAARKAAAATTEQMRGGLNRFKRAGYRVEG